MADLPWEPTHLNMIKVIKEGTLEDFSKLLNLVVGKTLPYVEKDFEGCLNGKRLRGIDDEYLLYNMVRSIAHRFKTTPSKLSIRKSEGKTLVRVHHELNSYGPICVALIKQLNENLIFREFLRNPQTAQMAQSLISQTTYFNSIVLYSFVYNDAFDNTQMKPNQLRCFLRLFQTFQDHINYCATFCPHRAMREKIELIITGEVSRVKIQPIPELSSLLTYPNGMTLKERFDARRGTFCAMCFFFG